MTEETKKKAAEGGWVEPRSMAPPNLEAADRLSIPRDVTRAMVEKVGDRQVAEIVREMRSGPGRLQSLEEWMRDHPQPTTKPKPRPELTPEEIAKAEKEAKLELKQRFGW